MSDLDADDRGELTSSPTRLELHDALIVGVEREGEDRSLRMERVYVYAGDQLLRQEGGRLRLGGITQCRVDGNDADFEVRLEHGSVLSWSLERGAGWLLIEWCAYGPSRVAMGEWTFRYSSCRWVPEFEHVDGASRLHER